MIKLSCPAIGGREIEAVSDVLKSLDIANGKKTKQFEKEIGSYVNRKYTVAVSSGTSALRIALLASGAKPGDKIMLAPFCCDVVLNVILDLGCEPVFCDIDEDTFNISPESLEGVDVEDAKAIVVVHNFGFPNDMHRIQKIVGEKTIIEDAAQAMGSKYKGLPAGSFGDVSVFSFYATKLLTTGEGGALLTDDENICRRAKYLRIPGQPTSHLLKNPDKEEGDFPDLIPLNYKMTDLHAAMGIVQLSKLDGFCRRRQEIARMYDKGLQGTGIKLPASKNFGEHVYSRYTLTFKDEAERGRFANHLINNGIEVGILWPRPLHLSPKLSGSGFREGNFPVAEKLAKRVLSIPMHPGMTDEQVRFVIEKIKEL